MAVDNLKQYIDELVKKSDGLISICIVNSDDGQVVHYYSVDSNIDNQLSASFQIQILRQVARGLNYIDELNDKKVNDIIISLNEQNHFIFSSIDNLFVVHIIADSKTSNIGMIKMLHNKSMNLLNSFNKVF